jgi:hypothetical protein
MFTDELARNENDDTLELRIFTPHHHWPGDIFCVFDQVVTAYQLLCVLDAENDIDPLFSRDSVEPLNEYRPIWIDIVPVAAVTLLSAPIAATPSDMDTGKLNMFTESVPLLYTALVSCGPPAKFFHTFSCGSVPAVVADDE